MAEIRKNVLLRVRRFVQTAMPFFK